MFFFNTILIYCSLILDEFEKEQKFFCFVEGNYDDFEGGEKRYCNGDIFMYFLNRREK